MLHALMKNLLGAAAVLLATWTFVAAEQRYDGYEVIKVQTRDGDLLNYLTEHNSIDTVDVWRHLVDSDGIHTVTFHAEPSLAAAVCQRMDDNHIQYEVLYSDLQSELNRFEEINTRSKKADDPFSYYYSFDELQQFLLDQVAACGTRCSIVQIGTSFEGRPLNLIKITGAPRSECYQKPALWIDAGIHAREWISESTSQFLINGLISEYDTDPVVRQIRDTYDIYVLPCVNPDGYSFSWTNNRMWRKSRQTYTGTTCIGTDINRNFDFQWMTVGASNNPCSETYAGPRPNSEPEAAALSDFMLARNGTWELFITLHSYGQLFMSPWGYTNQLPSNYDSLSRVGTAAVQAIYSTHGKTYQFGSAANILYQSSGTSRDWAAGVPRIPFVYTIELRDESSFDIPATEIRPTGEEIWAAFKTTVTEIQKERPGDCLPPPAQRG